MSRSPGSSSHEIEDFFHKIFSSMSLTLEKFKESLKASAYENTNPFKPKVDPKDKRKTHEMSEDEVIDIILQRHTLLIVQEGTKHRNLRGREVARIIAKRWIQESKEKHMEIEESNEKATRAVLRNVYAKAVDKHDPLGADLGRTLKRTMGKIVGLPVSQVDLSRHWFPKDDDVQKVQKDDEVQKLQNEVQKDDQKDDEVQKDTRKKTPFVGRMSAKSYTVGLQLVRSKRSLAEMEKLDEKFEQEATILLDEKFEQAFTEALDEKFETPKKKARKQKDVQKDDNVLKQYFPGEVQKDVQKDDDVQKLQKDDKKDDEVQLDDKVQKDDEKDDKVQKDVKEEVEELSDIDDRDSDADVDVDTLMKRTHTALVDKQQKLKSRYYNLRVAKKATKKQVDNAKNMYEKFSVAAKKKKKLLGKRSCEETAMAIDNNEKAIEQTQELLANLKRQRRVLKQHQKTTTDFLGSLIS
jgi:hypothetical protein